MTIWGQSRYAEKQEKQRGGGGEETGEEGAVKEFVCVWKRPNTMQSNKGALMQMYI